MKTPDPLANWCHAFSPEHLVQQRNPVSHTVAAYRDTFRLLLRFLQRTRRTTASQLTLNALDSAAVLDFLSHLEKERHNSVPSRNARLAAIRSFLHYASDLLGPDLPEATRRILSLPSKRHPRPLKGFLTREEMAAVLRAADNSWTGRRNYLLFLLLYNTGGRVSEILSVRVRDATEADGRQVLLHGKGGKEGIVPLWPQTGRTVRGWIRDNPARRRRSAAPQPLFPAAAHAIRDRVATASVDPQGRGADAVG